MTELVKQVHTFFDTQRVQVRYLTLFYGITLGLALILALLAIYLYSKATPGAVASNATQVSSVQTVAPTLDSTQGSNRETPVSLPAIPPIPNVKTPSALGVAAAELQGVEVNLWHPWTLETGEVLQALLDEFNRTNQWGITVEASAYQGFGSLDEAVESALLTNTQPDVIVDYGYQAQIWDGRDAMVNLSPYVDDPVWGLSMDEQADFFPTFWAEDITLDQGSGATSRLGIPYYRSAYVMFYNQSWAKELGYPNPPVTPEDFRVRACAAAEHIARQGDKSNLGRGGWLITAQPGVLVGWFYAFGADIADPNGQGYKLNTAETQQAMEYLKGLQASGCAWYDTAADASSEFADRRALFIVGSLFDIPTQQQAFDKVGSNDQWMVLPFPSRTDSTVDSYGPSLLITRSNPARQLAAWLVIQWLSYPPNQAEWVGSIGTYPTRQSAMSYLGETTSSTPQQVQALALIPEARGEPSMASWSVMRWAFVDVMGQLFSPQFNADQIPALLGDLQSVATEIFVLVR